MNKYISEGFGTFLLSFVVGTAVLFKTSFLPVPIIATLALFLIVSYFGHVSGAMVNPALTIAAWTIKKISWQDALVYILSQFVGASFSVFVFHVYIQTYGKAFPVASMGSPSIVFIAECVGSILFGLGVAAVLFGRVEKNRTASVVSLSLLVGIAFASMFGSAGILNPAVAFSILGTSFTWIYAVAPIVGAIIGMNIFKLISEVTIDLPEAKV